MDMTELDITYSTEHRMDDIFNAIGRAAEHDAGTWLIVRGKRVAAIIPAEGVDVRELPL